MQAPTNDYHCNTASKLSKIFDRIQRERIALSGDAVRSMGALERWNCSDLDASVAINLAQAVRNYLRNSHQINDVVKKYVTETAIEVAETMLEQLHSIRVGYAREWNRLIAKAMRQKVNSIKAIRVAVTVVRRVMNHFRSPRVHRSRRMRLATASADPGDDAGPDADRPDVASTGSLLAGGARS